MKTYPSLVAETIQEVSKVLREIVRIRNIDDVSDFNNLPNIFIQGRKVSKIPSAHDDVDATDREGDFNYNSGYQYRLINDSGTLKWARTAHGSISW